MESKTQKLKLDGKDLIFRKEGRDFYVYCMQTLGFYKFNEIGFKIILLLSREIPPQKLLKTLGHQHRLTQKQSVQCLKNFTNYLVVQKLISKKTHLRLGFTKQ